MEDIPTNDTKKVVSQECGEDDPIEQECLTVLKFQEFGATKFLDHLSKLELQNLFDASPKAILNVDGRKIRFKGNHTESIGTQLYFKVSDCPSSTVQRDSVKYLGHSCKNVEFELSRRIQTLRHTASNLKATPEKDVQGEISSDQGD